MNKENVMEIDEMKVLWQELSENLEKQQLLTDKIIMDMTHQNYQNKIKKILMPERIGSIICFAALIFILVNFHKLDTLFLVICGITTASYLLILPIFSLRALNKMHNIDIANNSYAETISEYTEAKKNFWWVMKIGFYSNIIFLLALLPVFNKISGNNSTILSDNSNLWMIPVVIIVLLFFSKWVFNHYRKTVDSAEDQLRHIE